MAGEDMSLLAHWEELRRRCIITAIAILIAASASFLVTDYILKLLILPSGGLQLRAFSLLDGFMIKLRLALYTGIVLSFPVWAFQILRFVSPGLKPEEKRGLFPLLVSAVLLFAAGTAFGYYLLWGMIRVLIRLFPAQVEYFPSAVDYLSFVVFFLLACGIAFEMPCMLILLVRLRILKSDLLRKKRRVAYFILFAFAEIITPVSDPIVAPMTVMLPLVILYEISLLVARRIEARRPTISRPLPI
ncbi:MAG: twin-arginine translocase subunit TatC [Rectinemataceae bacterium]